MTNLSSIKSENINAVFISVAKKVTASRSEIADETGLSLVTVGKIADSLVAAGALIEEKRVSGGAGRRAGILSLSPKKYILVIDREPNRTTASFCNFLFNCIDYLSFDRDTSIDDIFADTAMRMIEKHDPLDCLGVGILSDDTSEWGTLSGCAKRFFPDMRSSVSAPVNSATLLTGEYVGRDELAMYISVRHDSIRGAFVMNGQIVPHQHERYADLGVLTCGETTSLLDKMNESDNPKESGRILGECFFNILHITYPDALLIENEDCAEFNGMTEYVRELINRKCGEIGDNPPKIVAAIPDKKCAHCGMIIRMGRMWINSVVIG